MTDRLAQHCRFSEEYNAAYRIFSSATVGSQRKASLRYCPGQTTTILISGFSFARSKKRAENLRRRSSALGASGDTELFEKASNINGFQGGRVANNLYISTFRATVFQTAALFLYPNSSVVIRVEKLLFLSL